MKEIPLTRGRVALVDDLDFGELNEHKWYAMRHLSGTFYAKRSVPQVDGKRGSVLMHRQILGAQPGEDVDHRNSDGLDNQRANIRRCTRTQNNANARKRPGTSSRFKGVCKRGCKWEARINIAGKRWGLGRFDDEFDAALAYNVAALDEWHEFALLNVIPDMPETQPCQAVRG